MEVGNHVPLPVLFLLHIGWFDLCERVERRECSGGEFTHTGGGIEESGEAREGCSVEWDRDVELCSDGIYNIYSVWFPGGSFR